jgi:hypothetical protein
MVPGVGGATHVFDALSQRRFDAQRTSFSKSHGSFTPAGAVHVPSHESSGPRLQ